MAIASGASGLHGCERAHAAVLLVELPVDLHHLARRFWTASQQTSADYGVSQGKGFDHVAGFGDAAIGENADTLLGRCAGGYVECCQLRDSDAGNDPSRTDRTGALSDLDDARA